MMVDQETLEKLRLLRQELHQYPELSGQESRTTKKILGYCDSLKPDEVLTQLGGEGIAFIYQGLEEGPTTLVRCELDGLPVREDNQFPYHSSFPGRSHACGHDGHMAIVTGLGMALAKDRPKKGKVILLFQPAEETGEGAARIVSSDEFASMQPDYAFALHNLPGYNTNTILLKEGVFAAASKGMEICLKGRTSHAAFPEDGNSPATAMSSIILDLQKLPERIDGFSLVTVVNASLGEISFGTTPGDAVVRVTLRSFDDRVMDQLVSDSEDLVQKICREHHLDYQIGYRECFISTINHSEACSMVEKAAKELSYTVDFPQEPFRWSEDFGQFSKRTKAAIFGVGAGTEHPQLHESLYDFPDEIIPTGIAMFMGILKQNNY